MYIFEYINHVQVQSNARILALLFEIYQRTEAESIFKAVLRSNLPLQLKLSNYCIIEIKEMLTYHRYLPRVSPGNSFINQPEKETYANK